MQRREFCGGILNNQKKPKSNSIQWQYDIFLINKRISSPLGAGNWPILWICSVSINLARRQSNERTVNRNFVLSSKEFPVTSMKLEGVQTSLVLPATWASNFRAHNSILRLLIASYDMPNCKLKCKACNQNEWKLPGSKRFLCAQSNVGTFFGELFCLLWLRS